MENIKLEITGRRPIDEEAMAEDERNEDEIYIPKMEDLSYLECTSCKNFFFILEMMSGINDPTYCPYCGARFTKTIHIDGGEDDDTEEENY